MRNYVKVVAAVFGMFVLGGCGHAPQRPELQTVPNVDLQKYLGVWYEIARFPHSFEKDCVAVTATYTMRPDGQIHVLNQCRKHSLDGQPEKAEGRAWIADGKDASKLKVSFFLWFAGDYWIIELDPDYQYAVVGAPNRDYLWILSRTPQMDDALYQDLVRRIAEHGYDTQRIERVLQPAP